MRKILLLVLTLLSPAALSAPFVTSEPLESHVTHCGIFLDAAPKVVIPVVADVGGNICKFDVSGVSNGAHTIIGTAIVIDPVWGSLESVESVPLDFVRPAQPATPGLLKLTP